MTQREDFPWYWEPTSSLLGILGGERTKLRERGGKGNRTEAERGRGCGVRDGRQNVSGDGVSGDRKREEKKRREWKLRQDSCLPGYPHLFIDLGMIECNWVAAWQQKSAWRLHVDELIVVETLGSRLLKRTISDVWKQVGTCNCISYLAGFGKAFM